MNLTVTFGTGRRAHRDPLGWEISESIDRLRHSGRYLFSFGSAGSGCRLSLSSDSHGLRVRLAVKTGLVAQSFDCGHGATIRRGWPRPDTKEVEGFDGRRHVPAKATLRSMFRRQLTSSGVRFASESGSYHESLGGIYPPSQPCQGRFGSNLARQVGLRWPKSALSRYVSLHFYQVMEASTACRFAAKVLETGNVSLLTEASKLQARDADFGKNLQYSGGMEGNWEPDYQLVLVQL